MAQNVNYYTNYNIQANNNQGYVVNYPYYIEKNGKLYLINGVAPQNNLASPYNTISYNIHQYNNNGLINHKNLTQNEILYNNNNYKTNNINPLNYPVVNNQLIQMQNYPNQHIAGINPQINNNNNINRNINNLQKNIITISPNLQTNTQQQGVPKVIKIPNQMRVNTSPTRNPNITLNNVRDKIIKNKELNDNKKIEPKILNKENNNNQINPIKNKDNKNTKQPNINYKQKELIPLNQPNNSPKNNSINNINIQKETKQKNNPNQPIQNNNNNIINQNQREINNHPQDTNNNINQKENKQPNNIINPPKTINKINQKVNNQNNNNINLPQDNNKENINKNVKNNEQSNNVTVKKINNNAQTNLPVPPKPRPLELSDFNNIIYNEIGMINLGNTCFINSILQVLIHCPYFIYSFFNQHKAINKNDTIISAYFYDICIAMINTLNTQEKYIDITNFKTVFGTKHPTYEGYLENDSQEFCRVFLEDLSNELNIAKNKNVYRILTNTDKKTKSVRDKEFDKNFKEREHSIITELFYSQIITTYTCECKASVYSFQKILDFPLLLKENLEKIDIYDLLRIHFQDEIIHFETICENCKKVQKHKKEIKISRPPIILILSLQRIDPFTQKKNECVVTFPKVLNMSEFIDHECGFDKEPIYNLFAVVNHHGKIDSGHYFSYIKFHKKECWYEFNDSSVKKIGENIESFPLAYALFYIKNTDKK